MDTTTKVNGRRKALIEALLCDQPIAYHPLLARAVGSTTAAILLSQFLYWTPRAADPDGWFYKTRDEISAETALTRAEQEGARGVLRRLGITAEKRRGVPARMYFRVDMDRLSERIGAVQMAETLPSSWRKFRQQDGGRSADKPGETAPTTSETTAESFPKISSREVKPSNIRAAFSQEDEDASGRAGSDQRLAAIREALASKGVPGFQTRPQPPHSSLVPAASGPPPDYIAAVMTDIVRDLGEGAEPTVNVDQALGLWEQSGSSVQAFVDLLYELQAEVRNRRRIRNRLGYFFTCLRRALALPAEDAASHPPEQASEPSRSEAPASPSPAVVRSGSDGTMSNRFSGAPGSRARSGTGRNDLTNSPPTKHRL